MEIRLLGQGYEAISKDSVGNQLIKFLSDKEFHTFTGISAFASQGGINGLSKHLIPAKEHLKNITIVTGVDQKGTSQEALLALLNLNIKAFIYYQPSKTIFHPKIYLFEGVSRSELIIGSSNLTSHGLFANVEASLLISIDNTVESGRNIIMQLKDYFKGIFDYSDPNLTKLTKRIISDLVRAKVVPTEEERKAAQDKAEKAERAETEKIISKIFPKRATAKIPIEFRGPKNTVTKTKANAAEVVGGISKKAGLVWESGKLSERDLNIPKGSTTNPTGSMLFKKGKTKGIDQRHYFRDTVFPSLIWKQDTNPDTSHLERAEATFNIIIDGKLAGRFKLALTHNPLTDTRSYEQNNSMTSISWGEAKKIIAQDNLIGKNATLYKTKKTDEFILEIQ